MPKFKDLTNQEFGRLKVIERDPTSKQTKWICQCSCGNIKSIRSCHLLSNAIRSCGCLLSETTKQRNSITKRKHGMLNSRLYNIWRGIIQRCYNSNSKDFPRYGGRGITMCDEWKNDFQSFYDWSINNGYRDDFTIDRQNNDGNYEPSNCRWVTVAEQNRNRSISIILSDDNEIHSIKEWSDILGVKYQTIYYYYSNKGLDIKEIRMLLEEEQDNASC